MLVNLLVSLNTLHQSPKARSDTSEAPRIRKELPMHKAAYQGLTDQVGNLIQGGADKEAVDLEGRTPLHLAVIAGEREVVSLLLEQGANTEAADIEGRTPLHFAAYLGLAAIVQDLIDAGADLNAEDLSEITPLQLACQEKRFEVIQRLLMRGASIAVPSSNDEVLTNLKQGMFPIHLATAFGTVEDITGILRAGADIQARDYYELSPLHTAAVRGFSAGVTALLEAEAKVDALDRDKYTPLHCAAVKGKGAVIAQLCDAGAHVHAADDQGKASLHLAAQSGHTDAVAVLLSRGANPKIEDREGNTPLHFLLMEYWWKEEAASLLCNGGIDFESENASGTSLLDLAKAIPNEEKRDTIMRILLKDSPEDLQAYEIAQDPSAIIQAFKNEKNSNAFCAHIISMVGERILASDELKAGLLKGAYVSFRLEIMQLLVKLGADEDQAHLYEQELFISAVSDKDIERLSMLLSAGFDPNKQDFSGWTGINPLHIAAQANQAGTVRYLLDHSADPNIQSRDEKGTPLHYAARFFAIEAMRALIEKGASIEAVDRNGDTPMHTLLKYIDWKGSVQELRDLIELISERKPDLSLKNHFGESPFSLIFAMERKERTLLLDSFFHDMPLMREAAEVAQDPNKVTKVLGDRKTPNALCAALVKMLGKSVNKQDRNGNTPLHAAWRAKRYKDAYELLNRGANRDILNNKNKPAIPPLCTLLHLAAASGKKDDIPLLIAAGEDVNQADHQNKTALDYAAREGNHEEMEILLEHGADITIRTNWERTSLMSAALAGSKQGILTLLDHAGPQILDDVDDENRSALYYAARYEKKDALITLLEVGADPLIFRQGGVTLMHAAAESGSIETVSALLDRCPNLKGIKDEASKTALHHAAQSNASEVIPVLLDAGMSIDEKDSEGFTPLHLAVRHDSLAAIEALLKGGANTEAKTLEDGFTPIYFAQSGKAVRMLIEAGADPNAVDHYGDTPLGLVAFEKGPGPVAALIDGGVLINHQNIRKGGNTPLHYAVSRCISKESEEAYEAVRVLSEKGANIHINYKDEISPLMCAQAIEDPVKRDRVLTLLHSPSLASRIAYNISKNPDQVSEAFENAPPDVCIRIAEALTPYNINDKNENGDTALHVACREGLFDVARFLVDRGAVRTITNKQGNTPIQLAFKSFPEFRNYVKIGSTSEMTLSDAFLNFLKTLPN